MQVASSTSYTAMMQLTKAQPPIDSATSTTSGAASASTSTPANSIGAYDFTDMTPNQMQSAAQALASSGKIDSTQAIRLQFMGMPLGTMVDGKFQPLTAAQRDSFANTPVNYVQVVQSNMAFLQQNGEANDPKAGYADDQAILAAMQQTQGAVSSVDITA
jgi:hypothetical protein